MAGNIIERLRTDLRALREVQAPQQVTSAPDRVGGYRVSSAAFMPGRDQTVSVDLEESFLRANLDIRSRYPAMPRAVALIARPIGEFLSLGMTVVHAPIPENEHHGEVRSAALNRKQLREAARKLADECEILEAINLAEVRRQVELAASKGVLK